MKHINILTCLLLLFIFGCKSNNGSKTEITQKHRDKIINVGDKIVDIKPEILFGNSLLYIIDSILIVNETSPKSEKGLHLFNKNTFKYITSTGIIGRGPGEIIVPGRIGIDYKNKILWVPDHGKKVMWKFPLDSILNNSKFKPTVNFKLKDESFIERFGFINDSIVLGKAVQITSYTSFVMAMSKFNLRSKVIEKYGYEHPETVEKKSNSLFAVSVKNNCYVNCYDCCDLMTICDLNGTLKYNVYGADGLSNENNRKSYYFGVDFMGKNIIASYIGDIGIVFDGNRPMGNTPTKLLVFDLDGNYKQTIETGNKFTFFCVDEENKRVIAYFNSRENPLGYFDLNIN